MCLHVIIHENDDISLGVVEAGHDGVVLPGIAGQLYRHYVVVVFR